MRAFCYIAVIPFIAAFVGVLQYKHYCDHGQYVGFEPSYDVTAPQSAEPLLIADAVPPGGFVFTDIDVMYQGATLLLHDFASTECSILVDGNPLATVRPHSLGLDRWSGDIPKQSFVPGGSRLQIEFGQYPDADSVQVKLYGYRIYPLWTFAVRALITAVLLYALAGLVELVRWRVVKAVRKLQPATP